MNKDLDCAKKQAEAIIKEALEFQDQVRGASLLYVDDMLAEVSLVAKRAKESIRIIMQQALEDFDQKIDMIECNQKEILEDLRELSENGTRPIRKADYDIRVDEAYQKKVAYDIKIHKEDGIQTESVKPAKQPYEIKVAKEWQARVAKLEEEPEQPVIEKIEEDSDNTGFQTSDFDLDQEYFEWLEGNDK